MRICTVYIRAASLLCAPRPSHITTEAYIWNRYKQPKMTAVGEVNQEETNQQEAEEMFGGGSVARFKPTSKLVVIVPASPLWVRLREVASSKMAVPTSLEELEISSTSPFSYVFSTKRGYAIVFKRHLQSAHCNPVWTLVGIESPPTKGMFRVESKPFLV